MRRSHSHVARDGLATTAVSDNRHERRHRLPKSTPILGSSASRKASRSTIFGFRDRFDLWPGAHLPFGPGRIGFDDRDLRIRRRRDDSRRTHHRDDSAASSTAGFTLVVRSLAEARRGLCAPPSSARRPLRELFRRSGGRLRRAGWRQIVGLFARSGGVLASLRASDEESSTARVACRRFFSSHSSLTASSATLRGASDSRGMGGADGYFRREPHTSTSIVVRGGGCGGFFDVDGGGGSSTATRGLVDGVASGGEASSRRLRRSFAGGGASTATEPSHHAGCFCCHRGGFLDEPIPKLPFSRAPASCPFGTNSFPLSAESGLMPRRSEYGTRAPPHLHPT